MRDETYMFICLPVPVMGAFLDKPKTEKHNEKGKGNNLAYALSSMQGWRVEMEDAHSAHIGLPGGYKDWSFFGVFDGHAGAKVSMYCSEQLIEAITTNDDFRSIKSKAANGRESKETHTAIVKKAIRRGFLELDNKVRALPEIENGEDKSGTTVTSVMLSPTHIYFANCGDSRAVLSRNGKVAFSTQDHKPTNPVEKERIQNAGGSVMIQRVNGALAVSRALGDFEYKSSSGRGQCEQLVSPEPDVHIEDRVDADEFLVLACDGIWDVMSNEEVCDFVRDRLQVTSDLVAIANLLVDTCLYKVGDT
jgi:protein phosphatase 1B